VEQLEADVRRYLAGMPVAARPAGRVYQARKFLRRHRIAVSSGSAAVLLTLGLSLVAVIQAVRIRTQAVRIRAQAVRIEQQTEGIAREQRRASLAMSQLGGLSRLPTEPNVATRAVTKREVLDRIASGFERDPGDPGIRAPALLEIAQTYAALGEKRRARELLTHSIALARQSDEPITLASALAALGALLTEERELTGAEQAYRESLELRQNAFGQRHSEVARTLNGLAGLRMTQGRFAAAESLSRAALAMDRAQPTDTLGYAESLMGVANARFAQDDYQEATSYYRTALSLRQKKLGEQHPTVAATLVDLAVSLKAMRDPAADSILHDARVLYERIVAASTKASPADVERVRAFSETKHPAKVASRAYRSIIIFNSGPAAPDGVGSVSSQEAFIMNPDGSGRRQLTHENGLVLGAVISPDGKEAAFARRGAGQGEIFVMDIKSGHTAQVTNMSAMGMGVRVPSWSPDGRRLIFTSFTGRGLWVINIDGTGLTRLLDDSESAWGPSWSPTGDKIVFVSDRDGTAEIYVMNADGTNPVRLTRGAVSKAGALWFLHPQWSPDGHKIAFTSDRDGNREIYVMNADGSGLTRLTRNQHDDGHPSWSPDGTQIVYMSKPLDHMQIFVMNADGSSKRPLTESSAKVFNVFPSWGVVAPAPTENPKSSPMP
jgi:TolB protein